MSHFFANLKGARHIALIALLFVVAAVILVWLGSINDLKAGDIGAEGTSLEARMESVLSKVKGAGAVRVLIRESDQAVSAFAQSNSVAGVEGVVVVAEGADQIRVQLELQQAVQALLGIEPGRIEVLTMQKEGG